MGMFCLCGYGEKSCCICGAGDGCLAGNGDDDFFPATKEQIIERLDRNQCKRQRDIMIKTLKEKFNYEYTDIPEKLAKKYGTISNEGVFNSIVGLTVSTADGNMTIDHCKYVFLTESRGKLILNLQYELDISETEMENKDENN